MHRIPRFRRRDLKQLGRQAAHPLRDPLRLLRLLRAQRPNRPHRPLNQLKFPLQPAHCFIGGNDVEVAPGGDITQACRGPASPSARAPRIRRLLVVGSRYLSGNECGALGSCSAREMGS